MSYRILISGERANFTTLEFDSSKNDLIVTGDYAAPFNASWVEKSSSSSSTDHLIGLSEGEESGSLYTFEIDHTKQTSKITSQKPTIGAPAHFITLRDGSAIVAATYMGGSIALYLLSSNSTSVLLAKTERTEVFPTFPYASTGHGPDDTRQRQCHVHQILEDKQGFIYAVDLGSDRVWIFRRDGAQLHQAGWLQCGLGSGPRHAVFTPEDNLLYVIGELSHTVVAFDMTFSPKEGIRPIDGFEANIIPTSIHADHQAMMDAAEISLHPTIPNVLYVSNRWAKHIAKQQPELQNVPEDLPPGDTIAIILLSSDGRQVESIKHISTNLDVIRGMRLSEDGKYAAAVGQEGGGIEVYAVTGERGNVWTLVADLSKDLEGGIKHAVWL